MILFTPIHSISHPSHLYTTERELSRQKFQRMEKFHSLLRRKQLRARHPEIWKKVSEEIEAK